MAYKVLLLGLIYQALWQVNEGSFYISTKKSSWTGYNDGCVLATPDVKAGPDRNYHVIEHLGIDIPTNESVWVGYYQVAMAFEYIGCVKMKDIIENETHPYIDIEGDPGHCFPGCGDDTVVGVTTRRCYCLNSDVILTDTTKKKCTQTCYNPIVACGQDEDDFLSKQDIYLSIYKINHDVPISRKPGVQEGNCLKVQSSVPLEFIWDKCNLLFEPLCSYDEYIQRKPSFNATWMGAANICFHSNMLPVVYSKAQTFSQPRESTLWTGIFKTNVVYKYTSISTDERIDETELFGYLAPDSGNVKLQFKERNDKLRKLCQAGNDLISEIIPRSTKASSLDPTTFTFHHPSITFDEVGNDELNISEISTLSTTTSSQVPTTTFSFHHPTTESSFEKNYIIIAVCAIVSLLTLNVVSLIICCRHRIAQNISRQANYITPVYSTAIHENYSTALEIDSVVAQNDNTDLISEHYYAIPLEILDHQDQAMEDERNGTCQSCQSVTEDSTVVEEHDVAEQTIPKTYESLQEDNIKMINYAILTNARYNSENDSRLDVVPM